MMAVKPMFRPSLWLALCGLLCFLVSLFLPSIQLSVLGSPATFLGGQAIGLAVGLGSETIAHEFAARTLEKINFIVLGVSGMLNITFLIAPAVQIWGPPRPKVLWSLGVLSLLGLILGLVVPKALEEMHPVALIGYFVWLIGYVFTLGSIILALVATLKKTDRLKSSLPLLIALLTL
jgi:hypothetical protein